LFSFHHVRQDAIDPREVAVALRLQPNEHLRLDSETHRHLGLLVAETRHAGPLLIGQGYNVGEVSLRIVSGRLTLGDAAK
jgi:hypothetical protein